MRKPALKSSRSKAKNTQPKTFKGIDYKSRLEAYCAERLFAAGLPIRYEEVSFPLLEKFVCPAYCLEYRLTKNKAIPLTQNVLKEISPKILGAIYTPDFTDMEQGWVIEVKGQANLGDFKLRYKLFKKHLADNGLQLSVYMPNTKDQIDTCIQHILSTNKP